MNITSVRLRSARKKCGLSQEEVAQKLGITRPAYVRYETGNSNPYRNLDKLASIFGVTSDYLLGRSDEPQGKPVSCIDDTAKPVLIERIKELREREGLTQADLSKILKISPSTLGMYEQGRREPNFSTLNKLAKYFNVSTDYLLGRIEEKSVRFIYDTARRLRIAREKNGLSQAEVAERLGITRPAYVQYETGRSNPSRNIYKLATMFGVSADYLLGIDKPVKTIYDTAKPVRIPVLESIACRTSIEAVEMRDDDDKVTTHENGIVLTATNSAVYEPHFYSNEEIQRLPVQILGKAVEYRIKP